MDKRAANHNRTSFLLLGLAVALVPSAAQALDPFTNATDQLNNPNLTSGVAIGIADMNSDGLDDIVRLDNADTLEIEYQQTDGSFSHYVYGGLPGEAWGMAIGDIDRNGYPDIFAGGAYDGLKILSANDTGDGYDLTVMNSPSVFTQCVNFADIDANGTLDLFVCHDDGIAAPLNNDGTGTFTYDLGLINPASTVPSDNSGNYGTVWTDYDSDGDVDLYIAKCRLFVNNPNDGRRINLLFENDGNGNYTERADAVGLASGAQSWVMDFGDIDNDGDMDGFMVNHSILSQLYENQDGMFVDITPAGMTADLSAIDLGIQAHFEDFDNDTFIDLLVTGREGEHRLFINNGDRTFTAEVDPFDTSGHGIQSAVIGDLDSNGFPDVMAAFATGYNNPSNNPDRLFLNPGNDNNWLDIRLTGVESNESAAGARVELHGAWGVMVREVRAGEGYGITNSLTRHFGLGTAETIDSVVIHWPSGHVDSVENPAVLNQVVHIIEGCPEVWYADADGDGFGDASSTIEACLPPQGYVEDSTDCDDADPNDFPGNEEVCDGADNNCDGVTDEGFDVCEGESTGAADSTGATTVDPSAGPGTGNDATVGPEESTASGESTGDPGADDSSGGGGCGCDVSGSPKGAGFTLLGFGLLFGVRRRRFARHLHR